ncbi:heterokaryon incompatibility protein-domain-containing protein [Xylariaceae sp. FL0255]|nr:heterokaryon incompatibility protein-domain-containing protein [Xylariaceae sp. FL0255]
MLRRPKSVAAQFSNGSWSHSSSTIMSQSEMRTGSTASSVRRRTEIVSQSSASGILMMGKDADIVGNATLLYTKPQTLYLLRLLTDLYTKDQKPAPVRTPDGDISRVKQKLELLKTHETCRPGSHLPTRLVQVELKGVDNWQLKLVTTNEMREKPEAYAALTYIWGGEETYITTRDNLNDRQARIEFACLSKTIQDAVRVSYGLGIPYLWVDSQCILQKPDVKQEKYDLHEALLEQADIYSKATITIAASRSLHHDDGFLDERVFKMRVQDSAKQTLTKVLLWKLSTRTEREPIYTRGWTFQEYKLLKENGLL